MNFALFFYIICFFWLLGVVLLILSPKSTPYHVEGKSQKLNYPKLKKFSVFFVFIGILILFIYILLLWLTLSRPPLKTLGETRLWYSLFLPIIGLIIYFRWKYMWIIPYSIGLALVFLIINFLNPDVYDKILAPALQSIWFIPHVIVYLFAYALLGGATIVAFRGIVLYYKVTSRQSPVTSCQSAVNSQTDDSSYILRATSMKLQSDIIKLADNLVYIGFSFLTFGLLFGALWAKQSWGHYWTWDPKETWALLTWLCYLLYIHYRKYQKQPTTVPLWFLLLSFIVLLICWFGLNYLPSAEGSVHTY